MVSAQLRVFFALIFLISLTGSQCAFVARSGDDSSDDDDIGLIVVIREGRFIDAPVEGLQYTSGVVTGFTDADGRFRYQSGSAVRFSIGDIPLGQATRGKPVITPLDLVPGGSLDSPAVINIARLLQSLDAVPGDTSIHIPAALHDQARRSNAALSGAIEFLDYSDDTAFVNAASQLVAVLTGSYPFTAVLVDRDTAHRHLAAAVQALP